MRYSVMYRRPMVSVIHLNVKRRKSWFTFPVVISFLLLFLFFVGGGCRVVVIQFVIFILFKLKDLLELRSRFLISTHEPVSCTGIKLHTMNSRTLYDCIEYYYICLVKFPFNISIFTKCDWHHILKKKTYAYA